MSPLPLSVWNEGPEETYIDYEPAAMATFVFLQRKEGTTEQEIILHASSSPVKSIQNLKELQMWGERIMHYSLDNQNWYVGH